MTNAEQWATTSPVSDLLSCLNAGQPAIFTSSNPTTGEGWYGRVEPDGSGYTLSCVGEETAQLYSVDTVANILLLIRLGKDPGPYRVLDSSLRMTH